MLSMHSRNGKQLFMRQFQSELFGGMSEMVMSDLK